MLVQRGETGSRAEVLLSRWELSGGLDLSS